MWRATDTTLGREVALEVLPEDVVGDEDRRVRLEGEAKVLASINHPNVATLCGLEEIDGRLAAVAVDTGGGSPCVGRARVIAQTTAVSALSSYDPIPGTQNLVVINQQARAQIPLTLVVGLRRLLAGAER